MKLIVFGSTGSIGEHVVKQSLEKGFEVTAFCRDKSKLQHINHPKLNIVVGDVYKPESIEKVIKGHDSVCIALGLGKNRKGNVRDVGTKNIIAALQKVGIKRLICLSTLGAGDSKNNLNFFWKRIMFGWYLKNVLHDHEQQEKHVRESSLSWTIVRPGAYVKGERTEQYRHGFSPDDRTTKLNISRQDVADFIVNELTNNQYVHQTPGISY